MKEDTWKTTTFESLEYGLYAGIPNISNLIYQSRVVVRQRGKEYQYKTRRTLNINGTLGDVMTALTVQTAGMHDVEITTRNEAIGGGQGHYDYGVVTRATGWAEMTPEEVKAFKTLKHNVTSMRKAELEIKRLRKMADKLDMERRKAK